MEFLYFVFSYLKTKSKLCAKCLNFYEETVGQIPMREEMRQMFEEGRKQFGMKEDICSYCQKAITNLKEPVVVHNNGTFINYYHFTCYKEEND